MVLRSWFPGFLFPVLPLERLWRGLKKKPTARSLPAVGWKLFASLLAVSPRAGSRNSLHSRSRGNRHGRLGRNSLGGERNHTERKNSMRGDGCEEKVWKVWKACGNVKSGLLGRFFH